MAPVGTALAEAPEALADMAPVEATVVVLAEEAMEVRVVDPDMTMVEATEVQAADTDMTMVAATAVMALVEVMVEAMEVPVEDTDMTMVAAMAVMALVEATVVLAAEAMVVQAADTSMTMVVARVASPEEITAAMEDQAGMALVAMVLEAATPTADASLPLLGDCCELASHG
ncbi:uncharacterized protein LOC115753272 isoform X4 [Rhodamnia argentea]|uniref:Uncharacterized protein LOC115753272 isoform X4 n=1 Tax=Rhodamnia argentea TaxID=178133 RepID=A0ABM3HJG9_9MYRT|nr:uncharacterized protein LOC115753272 isoform X4 [Rhodamnia argentea]